MIEEYSGYNQDLRYTKWIINKDHHMVQYKLIKIKKILNKLNCTNTNLLTTRNCKDPKQSKPIKNIW